MYLKILLSAYRSFEKFLFLAKWQPFLPERSRAHERNDYEIQGQPLQKNNHATYLRNVTNPRRIFQILIYSVSAWNLRLNLTQHWKSHQARTPEGLTD